MDRELSAAPGSVSQVRESAARLVRYAKETGTAVFLVGHVTKDGGIAGPRVLEHMVDAVLYFEGESGSRFRVLRAFKNRFGAINELGVFAMADKGLREVPNPSAIFLSGSRPAAGQLRDGHARRHAAAAGRGAGAGRRVALSNPRRVAVGMEQNRLAMLLAVLHRHGGVGVGDQDVFANAVGGIRVQETAVDLRCCWRCCRRSATAAGRADVAFGEVGLSGEIRPVPNGEDRLKEAATHGFKRAIVPKGNAPKSGRIGEMQVIAVDRLAEALEACTRRAPAEPAGRAGDGSDGTAQDQSSTNLLPKNASISRAIAAERPAHGGGAPPAVSPPPELQPTEREPRQHAQRRSCGPDAGQAGPRRTAPR